MSVRHRLRTTACCLVLEMATLLGVPMRPEQIQDLMRSLNEPTIARAIPDESDAAGGPGGDEGTSTEAEQRSHGGFHG